VEEEVAEGADGGDAVDEPGGAEAAEELGQCPPPRRPWNLSGSPVAASSRKVTTTATWVQIWLRRKRRTQGRRRGGREGELAAQRADDRPLQPEQRVQSEEAEDADQQPGHRKPDPVDDRVALAARWGPSAGRSWRTPR
jgi:hypothetical protein